MQGDIEVRKGIDGADGIFGRSSAQVGEIDGILIRQLDRVIPVGIGSRAPAGIAQNADPIQRPCPVHIINRPSYSDLLPPDLAAGKD